MQLNREMDQLQRRMTAIIMSVNMLPGETPETLGRRRNQLVATRCREEGLWSKIHCERVIAWRNHLLRRHNSNSWAAMLYDFHGFDWLYQQRLDLNSNPLAGRTGTRSMAGFVATRWHDGVKYAESLASRIHRSMGCYRP